MAKRVIIEAYTFDPATKVVTINGKFIRRENLVLITNVTTNTVIYNFADAGLGATSYSATTTNNVEITTITLVYNTSSMSSTDKLAILVEEVNELMYPSETLMDANSKFRVTSPQALIDTDFEYGTQPTKWETLSLLNNRPSVFFDESTPITITSITATNSSRTITMVFGGATITTSTPIYIQDSILPEANGWFIPLTVVGSTLTFNIRSVYSGSTGSIFDSTKTFAYAGNFYTGAGIPVPFAAGTAFNVVSGTTVQCTTSNPHGLSIGDGIFIIGTTASSNAPNGTWFVKETPTATTFRFDVITAPTGVISIANISATGLTVTYTNTGGLLTSISVGSSGGTGYAIGDIVAILGGGSGGRAKVMATNGGVVTALQISNPGTGYSSLSNQATALTQGANTLFTRTWGASIHRPFDGGVEFSTGLAYHGNQLIRQTRRYFRYQSGKAIMFSTGSNMASAYKVDSMTSSGAIVTVTTKFPHNLYIGARLKIENATQTAYNGTGDGSYYTVTAVPTLTSFQYVANATPSATPATGNFTVQPYRWYGSQIKLGMFDNQNGFFFEFDGQTLYAVRRSATFQLAGYISVLGTGNQSVTGTNTQFTKQLNIGDFISIRGMTYTVHSISSDTSMTIYPDYRGVPILPPQQCIISRVDNFRVPQSSWNIDKLDGTGASGYNLDINKMQMWMIDYSWYGAGVIRFGVKNQRGEFIYCHRMAHANNQVEAYMRSGNLPARYEVSTLSPTTKLTTDLSNVETSTINVVSTDGFPPSGTVVVTFGEGLDVIEYINYTGKTATTFTGLTRAVTNLGGPGGFTNMGGTSTAGTFNAITLSKPCAVSLYSPQSSNTIAHWGSSIMMDGGYDDDKAFLFNFGQNSVSTFATSGTTYPVFSIRAAPSVDNGVVGILGARELINRMQVILRSMDVYTTTTAAVRVTLRLNARVAGTPGTWTNIGGASLVQYATHGTTSTITGGTDIYTFFVAAGGVTITSLTEVRDLGNSILGGGSVATGPDRNQHQYPDGPDVLTVTVTPLAANAAVAARLAWTEAQA